MKYHEKEEVIGMKEMFGIKNKGLAVIAAVLILVSVCAGVVSVEVGSNETNSGDRLGANSGLYEGDSLNLSVPLLVNENETKAEKLILLKVREKKEEENITMTSRKISEALKSRSYLTASKEGDSKLTPSSAMAVSQIEKPSSQLTITIMDETTASGEWLMHLPAEYATYIPYEKERFEKNIEGVEKGMEDLFLQDVQNINITEGNETLLVTFNLKSDYANSFVTGK